MDQLLNGLSALPPGGLLILIISALLIGINKTGIPGIGVLPVLLLTIVFPAWESPGIQLIMLCTADLIAVAYYRKKADWKVVCRLLPCAVIGIAVGALLMYFLRGAGDYVMRCIIGGIILGMEILNRVRKYWLKADRIPDGFAFAAFTGIFAGITTQMANAAGPVAALYLLAMRLPKEQYMGTCAWFFLIMNWIKLPVFICQHRITMNSFLMDVPMLPFLLIGAWLGIVFIRKIPQKTFDAVVEILILVAIVRLFWPT